MTDSDPSDRSAIARHLRVGGEKRDAFDEGLRDEESIERILMQWREHVDIHGVLAGDRQLGVAVVEKSAAQEARLDAKVLAAEGVLDRDFPETGGAEDQLVFQIVELSARGGGEPLGLPGGPEE